MKKRGFTLIELLVVIAIIAMLLAILMPALNKVKKIAQRVVCGTNLKGLGTAQSVYSNDYEDMWTKQGKGTASPLWAEFTPGFANPQKAWTDPVNLSVGSSLYLLVREADVSPKSFVCGAGGQTAYDGKNTGGYDLVELWDFGNPTAPGSAATTGGGPKAHVSYAFQLPYCNAAVSGSATAQFAAMADKNPWYDPKLTEVLPNTSVTAETFMGSVSRLATHWITGTAVEKWQIQVANAYAHGREGQNVMYGDGHSDFEKYSDVGVRHDNIYTRQNPPVAGNEGPIRAGVTQANFYKCPGAGIAGVAVPQAGMPQAAFGTPANAEDSLLVNDDQ